MYLERKTDIIKMKITYFIIWQLQEKAQLQQMFIAMNKKTTAGKER